MEYVAFCPICSSACSSTQLTVHGKCVVCMQAPAPVLTTEQRLLEIKKKAEEAYKKSIEDAERALLLEEKQREERERAERLRKLQEEKDRVEKESNDLVKCIEDINNSIANNHKTPLVQKPDFASRLQSLGFTKLEQTRTKGNLGGCFNDLVNTPKDLLERHKSLISLSDDYDNRYVMYMHANTRKYIIGCHRRLRMWDHECEVVVYYK
jgi:hypothetical protein